jgi:hypothetical protein
MGSPCTNHPLKCLLCTPADPAAWKYNIQSHLAIVHLTASAMLYTSTFDIMQDEKTLLKGALLEKLPKQFKKPCASCLVISEGHSS